MLSLVSDLLEGLSLSVHQWFRHPLSSMVELETESEDGRSLVSVRGDHMTLLRLDGLRYLPTEKQIEETSTQIRLSLKSFLTGPGHSVQFLFLSDPNRTPIYVQRHIANVRSFSEAVGLNIEPLLEERQSLWANAMCSEETYAAIWTRRSALNAGERKSEAARAWGAREKLPNARDTQKMWIESPLLSAKHSAFVTAFREAMHRAGVGTTRIEPHGALRTMREVFDPATFGMKWRARLPSDVPAVRSQDADPKGDLSCFLNPPLTAQFFRSEAVQHGLSQVDMGPLRFSPVDMTLPPETVMPFSRLYGGVRGSATPWRISFLLDGGGGGWLDARATLASILAAFSGVNKRIVTALETLKHQRNQGESFVRFRASAATWGPSSQPDLVHQRAATVESAIGGWGSCETGRVAGDPVQAMMSSALGLHATSTAPGADAPLTDVLRMMPWTRQGSPWSSGSLLYMTPEGRPYPYDPVGSKRTSVVKIILGPPGTGKSMLLNTSNIGLILSPAAVTGDTPALPFIRVADIGAGGKGVIDLLREALPPEQAHQVLYARFQNTEEFAYNIFDTQPGCRKPLSYERESIVNIIATKCTPEGGTPYESMSGLISSAIDEAYRYRSDEEPDSQPRTYQKFVEHEVDEALARHEVALRERATWWDVVDALHACGETHMMTIAQRHAVPLLEDLITAARTDYVADLYKKPRAVTGESILELFTRLIQEMTRDLEVLSKPTRFDLGEARVIVLNMEEVCRTGGARAVAQTQIMYLVATHILARDFLLREDHLSSMNPRYRDYNVRRIREFSGTIKLIGFDEMHYTQGCPQIERQIELFERTGRKNAFHMALCSQRLADFPKQIADLATEIFIAGLDRGETADEAVTRFGLQEGSGQIIRHHLGGPRQIGESGVYGAPFLAVWRLDDGLGQVEQILVNLIGPIEAWALSTRPYDVILRDQLYRVLGHRETWRRLSIVFPSGTARDEVERRANEIAARGKTSKSDARQAVIGGLVAEIVDGMGLAIMLRPAGDLGSGKELLEKHRSRILNWLEQS